jgi:hypothetical protein
MINTVSMSYLTPKRDSTCTSPALFMVVPVPLRRP